MKIWWDGGREDEMAKNCEKYSVLMSVYQKEKPEFLRESMESIYNQTVPTDDFVLICDGPLTEELDGVIGEMQEKFGKRLRVIRQAENRGLGYSLNLGVKECRNELIARMDSDDVAKHDRCEKELEVFLENVDLSVVGSNVAEFKESVNNIKSIRKVPEANDDIMKFAKSRNPLNHPSVMFKKQDVLAVGGYQDIRFCQDYFLWVNMLAEGYKCYNIQEVLVYMREDEGTFKRRSGMQYFRIQKRLINDMYRRKMLSVPQYMKSTTIRFCSAFAPNWLRQALFNKFMRTGVAK